MHRYKILPLLTPSSNTGSFLQNSFSVAIDWFQGTCLIPSHLVPSLVSDFSTAFLQPECVEPCIGKQFGSTRFPHGAKTLHGIRFAWTDSDDLGFVSFWFSVPASSLSRISLESLWSWLYCANSAYSFSVSRLDFCLDDFSKSLTPELFDSAFDSSDIVGNPSYRKIDSFDKSGHGFTRYIGSRSSERMVRFYNKDVESRGEIPSYRLETEFKDGKAKAYFSSLLDLSDFSAVTSFLVESIVGSVDFRDKSADSCVSRCPRLSWWSSFIEFVSALGGLRIAAPRRVSTFTDTLNWLSRSVATSLACLRQVFGHSEFLTRIDSLVVDGRKRLSSKHLQMIKLLYLHIDEVVVSST
jgi:Replication initiation factor